MLVWHINIKKHRIDIIQSILTFYSFLHHIPSNIRYITEEKHCHEIGEQKKRQCAQMLNIFAWDWTDFIQAHK